MILTASKASQEPEQVPLLKIKVEKNIENQSQIDTDENSSDGEEDIPLTNKKRKRILQSDTEPEDEPAPKDKDKTVQHKVKKLKRKSSTNLPKVSSKRTRDSIGTNVSGSSSSSPDDKKVEPFKAILEKLSQGKTEDPKAILHEFKEIIGPEGFNTLRSLFIQGLDETDKNKNAKPSNIQSIQKETQISCKRRKKHKTEAEKLEADIMEMFIRDGVLQARGLRNKPNRKYNEDQESNEFDEFEADSRLSIQSEFPSLGTETTASTPSESSKTSPAPFISSEEEALSPGDSVNGQKGNSSRASSEKESDVFEREKSPEFVLKEFIVPLKKLPIEQLFIDLTVEENGEIRPFESRTLAEEAKDLVKETIKSEQSNCSEPVQDKKNNDDIILIDDDDDIEDQAPTAVAPALYSPEPKKLVVPASPRNEINNMPSTDSQILIQTESKDQLVPRNSFSSSPFSATTIEKFENTVNNLGFCQVRNGTVFRCKAEKCNFISGDKTMFEYHTKSRHPLIRWSGWCEICRVNSLANAGTFGSLYDEFTHMADVHCRDLPLSEVIPPQNTSPETKRSLKTYPAPGTSPKRPQSVPIILNSTIAVVAPTPQIQPPTIQVQPPKSPSPKKAMLKLRNLPGDKLSFKCSTHPGSSPVKNAFDTSSSSKNDQQPADTPKNPSLLQKTVTNIPTAELPPGAPLPKAPVFITLANIGYRIPFTKPITAQQPAETKLLRPWLETTDQKVAEDIPKMLHVDVLKTRYKCMASKCGYAGDSSELFKAHLINCHKMNPDQSAAHWGRCCYCEFSSTDVDALIQHHKDHDSNMFACNYCFYRSFSDFLLHFHHKSYHAPQKLKMIKLQTPPHFDQQVFLNEVQSRKRSIPPIVCPICKIKFYVMATFDAHYKSLHSNDKNRMRSRCNKCSDEVTIKSMQHHLENCYNVKHYQCVHCLDAFSNIEALKLHLTDKHSALPPLFCERVSRKTTVDPSVPEDMPALQCFGVRFYRESF
jgi:hypothetical protein